MADRIYLDWNATAPLRPEARAAVIAAMDAAVGNPSSVHAEGRAARRLVEQARERVAALVGAESRNVVFTSGGTEANMMALTPALQISGSTARFDRLMLSSIEHASVRTGGSFSAHQVEEIPVTAEGALDIWALERRLGKLQQQAVRPLVSIMAANNETGVIQPIKAAAALVHAAGGVLHVDAVQVFGRVPFDINEAGADLVTVSAHKLGGPQGIGALIRRSDALHLAEPLLKGGGQERGARAGTENVAGISGFGAAAISAGATMAADGERMRRVRDRLEAGLAKGPTIVFSQNAERLPNTSLFAAPGLRAETALINLDLDGFAVSSGSACSSGKVTASHVLAAMRVPEKLSSGAIRVSIGSSTREKEIDLFLEAWMKLLAELSKRNRGLAA
ncbi:MAG TPA: cysteine desulfurase family protein [Xanthobacteraceae bacterium]|nr:cysteine desulfurase family protein [Xanthobacteraceae bacterium]